MSSSFPLFAYLYSALFGAYGTLSPLLPFFLSVRGQTPEAIGLLLGAGIVVRISTGPLVGLAADHVGKRLVLGLAGAGAGISTLLFLAGREFWPLLLVSAAYAFATGPLNPLADALSLSASIREGKFAYGWVRGIGSAAFIAGTLASGALVAAFGIESIVLSGSALFLSMLLAVPLLPSSPPASIPERQTGFRTLLAIPPFRWLLVVAALVIGSHAISDTFAIIHWRAAGLSAETVSIVWSVAVASEIVVFVLIGPLLIRRIGMARAAALSAVGGIVRWAIVARTNDVGWLCAAQSMHGLTFALMHLVGMRLIALRVPEALAATAQAVYGTLSFGLATALVTLFAGRAYTALGVQSFWLMSGLCALSLPFTRRLEGDRA